MVRFFTGWQRKLGLVTLLIACTFVVVLTRSQMVQDSIYFGYGSDGFIGFTTFPTGIKWAHEDWDQHIFERTGWKRKPLGTDDNLVSIQVEDDLVPNRFSVKPPAIEWEWQLFDFYAGAAHERVSFEESWIRFKYGIKMPSLHETISFIPYWFILLPLILISAWLLLSKPHLDEG